MTSLLVRLRVHLMRNHAPHEQGVIRVLENLSRVILEMSRATLVVLASVSKV